MLFGFEAQPTAADFSASEEQGDESEIPQEARLKWLFAALGLVAGLALAAGIWALWPSQQDALTQADVDLAIEEALADVEQEPSAATAVFDQIAPSLVVVRVTAEDEPDGVTIGGGVVINESGQILTASHVIADGQSIELVFADGSRAAAQVVSNEPAMDIAVVEAVGATTALVPAVMGNSRTLQVGDSVFAVGNPLGLTGSISAGVISGLNRDIPFPTEADEEAIVLEDLIQFDAAVNQGNSGGPLLNAEGQVVGIVTALADPSEQGFFIGIGFAVPIDIAAGGAANGPSQ